MSQMDLNISNYEINKTAFFLAEAAKLPAGQRRSRFLAMAYTTLNWVFTQPSESGREGLASLHMAIEDEDHDGPEIYIIGSGREDDRVCLRLKSSSQEAKNMLTSKEARKLALALLRAAGPNTEEKDFVDVDGEESKR